MACTQSKTPQQLLDEQQSGVCVVLNSYYFEMTLPSGEKIYSGGLDESGNFTNVTTDLAEAQRQRSLATGTGFFIDKQGTLLTNRHVVNPNVTREQLQAASANFLRSLSERLQELRESLAEEYGQLESQLADVYAQAEYWDLSPENEQAAQLQTKMEQLSERYENATNAQVTIANLDVNQIRVRAVSKIGIAYNNAHVDNPEDFVRDNPCEVVRVSDDEEVDLATIQLRTRETPHQKYIFQFRDPKSEPGWFERLLDDFDSTLAVGTKLWMIGYNAGLALGTTKQGIQAQLTEGAITQKPDGSRLLYSIPTLQGSSGSPVVDAQGYVRAVNFAKVAGTDTFNFGIPEERIRQFLRR